MKLVGRWVVIWLMVGTSPALAQELEEYLRQATSLMEQEPIRALKVLERGLVQFPDSTELLLCTGSLLTRLGRSREGEQMLIRALEREPHSANLLRQRGEAQLRSGRLAEAVRTFERTLWHDGRDGRAHNQLAYAQFLLGDDDAALRHAKHAVELDPLEPRFRSFYSTLLDIRGRRKDSQDQLKMAFRLAPNDPRYPYRLSRKQFDRGNLGQAIEYAEMALALDPENPLYLAELARFLQRSGQTEEARQYQQQAAIASTAFAGYLQALELKQEGRPDKAIEALQDSIRHQPDFVTGLLLLAQLQTQSGLNRETLATYRQILNTDPQHAVARRGIAWLHIERGNLNEAGRMLESLLADEPNSVLLAGYRQLQESDCGAALANFRRVAVSYPLEPGLLQLISHCLSEEGQPEEALQLLQKAARLAPSDPSVGAQMAELELDEAIRLREQGDWSEALKRFDRLIEAQSPLPEYYFQRAYCHQLAGHLRQAVGDYRKGLQQSPRTRWARTNLASSLYMLGRFREALQQWRQLTREQPSRETYTQLGLSFSQLGRDAEAEDAFQRALSMGPRDAALLYNLGVTRLRLKQLESAWALIRQAAKMGHSGAAKLLRKARLSRQGNR